ncbi:MAG: DUF4180 domain-containing protein [Solirubrobacterales bacterium]
MSIQAAILGLLSWQPLSGYDLKKLFADSPILPWSGNNNQIYKTLVQLLDDGLVSNEVYHSAHAPLKKIYSITESGRAALREWLVSEPEPPELRNTFLIRLSWADQLGTDALDEMVDQYESVIQAQLAMHREQLRRGMKAPDRTARETYLWEMIAENTASWYEHELAWIGRLKEGLQGQDHFRKEILKMQYIVREMPNGRLVECLPEPENQLVSTQYALDLVAACGEHDTQRLLIHAENLPPAFFDLKTKLAGEVLQKFVNYQIRAAAVVPPESLAKGRFREFALEANRGRQFRFFEKRQEAIDWLVE